MLIKETCFKVVVKPNSQNNRIIGFDNDKKAYLVRIKAKAKDNKASQHRTNKVLIQSFGKKGKNQIRLKVKGEDNRNI